MGWGGMWGVGMDCRDFTGVVVERVEGRGNKGKLKRINRKDMNRRDSDLMCLWK